MVGSFRHKALRQLFELDSPKWAKRGAHWHAKAHPVLMQVAERIEDLELPTFHLQGLKGERKRLSRSWTSARRFSHWKWDRFGARLCH
jgi:hypothetical protein